MRAFAWFLGAILLAGILAALLGYPIYQLTTHFAHFAFHRVTSRIAMLLLVVELVVLCRHLGVTRKADFGFDLPWRRFLASRTRRRAVASMRATVSGGTLAASRMRATAAVSSMR